MSEKEFAKDSGMFQEEYKCSYERDICGVIYVTRKGSTESIFTVTPVFHTLKLNRTWAKESELSTQKEVAKNYLKKIGQKSFIIEV